MKHYLRKATKEDMDLLFQWANDPLVRRNSFSTRTITYQEHENWFQSILENDNCRQYIYMEDDLPVGQVRVTIQENVAEIGYSVCAEKRSLGHGKEILRLISEYIWKEFPYVKKIVGRVKTENLASQKAFSDAGYEEAYRVYEVKNKNLT